MNHASLVVAICGLLLWRSARSSVLRSATCPTPGEIEPCECKSTPQTVLNCSRVQDGEDLRRVFRNSEGVEFDEVHIESSTLPYLPSDMLKYTPLKKVFLKNVTLVELLDTASEYLDSVESLFLENFQVLSSNNAWSLLEPLTQLQVLTVNYNPVQVLGSEFSESAPEGLQQVSFYATETSAIEPGTFAKFPNLEKVSFESCKLRRLSRDMFATPSNIQSLYFDGNKIKNIPQDLFTQMPNLRTVDLKNNLISTIPSAAFENNMGRISFVWFDGNPLKCDCLLQWLATDKPVELRGRCEAPKSIYGKHLKDLSSDDFDC